jgi:hypothetical protein
MKEAELARIREQFDRQVQEGFADAPIARAEVLQYGDEPEIEPGQLVARLVIETPDDPPERMRAFQSFQDECGAAIRALRDELDKLPTPVWLQLVGSARPAGPGETTGPMVQTLHGGPWSLPPDGPGQTPVMARLGRKDLATLDTLINAGIASSRADAVRWALARIRERPAFEQLRAHAREIENLKSQF